MKQEKVNLKKIIFDYRLLIIDYFLTYEIRNQKSVLVTTLFLCSMNLFAQIPQWYLEKKDIRYSSEFYWIGVGSNKGSDAKAKEQADMTARRDLVSQFKVKISSRISTVKSETRVGNSELLSENIENRTEAVIDSMEIVGLQIAKTEVKDNQTYALAVLEKEPFIQYLANGINDIVKRNEVYRSSADSMAGAGNVSGAIQLYLSVLNGIGEVFPKVMFYNIVSPKYYTLPITVAPEGIEVQLKNFLSNISLTIVSGNNQTGEMGKNLVEPFVIQAMVKSNSGSVPLKGISVQFKNGVTLADKSVTDGNGKASSTYLVNAEGLSGGKGKILASVILPNVSGDLRSLVTKNTTVAFEFSVNQSVTPCVVVIEGVGSEKTKEAFRKKLTQALEKNGMNVAESAPITVKATLSATSSGSVEGMAGTMYTQDVTVSIEVRETTTNKVLSSLSTTGKGLAKKDSDAIEKGILSLKIPAKDLAEALAKVK